MNEAGTVESREREAEWIGPYRVIGVLRRGVTFHVASESGNSSFVLKRPDGISRRKIRKRVSRLTSIQQPSLARVMGLLEEDGIVYTWREFIPGTPLSIVIRTLAAGDAFAATSKLLQIADGLSALHDKGMAHGNLHPGNLILSNEGRLVIVDSPESAFPPAWWPKMNDSRAIYLSPEQLRGYRPTPRSDLFAAGVIYHELCYGRYPFPGEGWLNEIRAIWSAEPADEIYKIMGATPKVRRVLQRLLQKRPVRRYASASELLEALDGPKRVRTAGWPRFRTPFRALRASVQTGADFALTPFSRLPVAKLVAAGTLLSAFIFGISLLRHRPHSAAANEVERLLEQGDIRAARNVVTAERQDHGDDPILEKLLGDIECKAGQVDRCLERYDRSLSSDDSLADDRTIRENVLALLGRQEGRKRLIGILARLDRSIVKPLVKQTESEDYWRRWNAVDALEERGAGDKIDYVQVYIRDLRVDSCNVRRSAAQRLKTLGDRDALAPLQEAKKQVDRSFFQKLCVGNGLDSAITALSK